MWWWLLTVGVDWWWVVWNGLRLGVTCGMCEWRMTGWHDSRRCRCVTMGDVWWRWWMTGSKWQMVGSRNMWRAMVNMWQVTDYSMYMTVDKWRSTCERWGMTVTMWRLVDVSFRRDRCPVSVTYYLFVDIPLSRSTCGTTRAIQDEKTSVNCEV